MFFVKYLKVLIIALFIVGVSLVPATAVQQGKVYSNLSLPQIGKLDQIDSPLCSVGSHAHFLPPLSKRGRGNE